MKEVLLMLLLFWCLQTVMLNVSRVSSLPATDQHVFYNFNAANESGQFEDESSEVFYPKAQSSLQLSASKLAYKGSFDVASETTTNSAKLNKQQQFLLASSRKSPYRLFLTNLSRSIDHQSSATTTTTTTSTTSSSSLSSSSSFSSAFSSPSSTSLAQIGTHESARQKARWKEYHRNRLRETYNESNPFPVRIVGIFVADSELPYTLELAKPSIDIAIEKAKVLFPLASWDDAVFRNGSNRCTANLAGVFAAEEFYLRHVTVFIGPSCGLALDPVARMAAHWRIPVISSGGPHVQFSNKEIFSTLTRLSFSLTNLGSFVSQIFSRFKWTHVSIIIQEKPASPLIPLVKETIVDVFEAENEVTYEMHEISRTLAKINLKNLMAECAKEARVIFILTSGETLRQILLAAYDMGMSNGGYVFLTVELFKHRSSFGNFAWFVTGDSRNEDIKRMYESLFILTVHVPRTATFRDFATAVVTKSRNEFNTSFTEKDVNIILAGFHDSVMLYGRAITETILDGDDPMDGVEVTKRIWNRTFEKLLSGDIFINSNGDKETDYTLKDFNKDALEMRTVVAYSGREDTITWSNESAIHWPGNWVPPSDVNVCHEAIADLYCHKKGEEPVYIYWDLMGAVALLALLVGIALFFLYRKVRLESELTSLWWKVRWSEILFIANQSERSLDVSGSKSPIFAPNYACLPPPPTIQNSSVDVLLRHQQQLQEQQQQKQQQQQQQQQANAECLSTVTTSAADAAIAVAIPQGKSTGTTQPATNTTASTMSEDGQQSLESFKDTGDLTTPAPAMTPLSPKSTAAAQNTFTFGRFDSIEMGAIERGGTPKLSETEVNKSGSIDGGGGGGGGGSSSTLTGTVHRPPKPHIRINDYFALPSYLQHPFGGQGHSRPNSRQTAVNFLMRGEKHGSGSAGSGGSLGSTGSGKSGTGSPSKSTLAVLPFGNRGGGGGNAGRGSSGAGHGANNNGDPKQLSSESLAPIPNKGIYKGSKVFVKHLNIKHCTVNRELLIELKQMKDLAHENLIRFVGICVDDQHISILTEYCEKGNLRDLLDNEGIRIDWPFRYSLINDIVEGMLFIHESTLSIHGGLKSTNCVIDSRLVVKLTDFGLKTLRTLSKQNSGPVQHKSLLWTSPEHLRQRKPEMHGSQKGDVYSFAIVLQEIITRSGPFETVKVVGGDGKFSVVSLDPQFIIHQLKLNSATPYRPKVDPNECSAELTELLTSCWEENPANRPSFQAIKSTISKIAKDFIGGSGNSFLENLLLRLEQYANDLEILVDQKTSAFFEEKKKCEDLLYELLPRTVADQLKRCNQVKPENFPSVTIFFSDIVKFTQIAGASTPMQTVDFLNDLYTLFDSIIGNYDCYKVETVGDAYLVVSGLPIRNGNEHARQISRMSLELMYRIKQFRIKHLPEQEVKLRIGLHSGPCAAGVIGLKMPRYCLFGDTVNMASRMESHGEPNKIHISEATKHILDKFGTFHISLRGDIYVKGKGIVRTYWLEGEHLPEHSVGSAGIGVGAGAAGAVSSAGAVGAAGSRARQFFGKRKFGDSEQMMLYEEDPNSVRPPSLCASSKEDLDDEESNGPSIAKEKVKINNDDDDSQQLISSHGKGDAGAHFNVAVDVEASQVCFKVEGTNADENADLVQCNSKNDNNNSSSNSSGSSPEPSGQSTPLL